MTEEKKEKKTLPKAKLYEFRPDEAVITPNNIVELSKVIRVGIGGETLEKLTPELRQHFKEVA